MQPDLVVMGGVGVVAMTGLAWSLLTHGDPLRLTSGLVAGAIAVVIVVGLLRGAALARSVRRLQRTDEVAELFARVATACEDVERLLRLQGGRLRTETIARVAAVLAAGNEAVQVWVVVVADRPSRLRRCERGGAQVLGELDAARARMLSEASIDGYAR